MTTNEEIRNFFAEKVEEFVKKLNGRFKEHVSNDFIKVYLKDKLNENYRKHPQDHLQNISYKAAVTLFESYLEYGCKAGGNGHHVAQDFASLFPIKSIKEI